MAAGLGFKTFTTGEVLTAGDVNGYLMQGVLVFASAAARDAAITSPQEGQACYLKDTNQVLTYSGSAWVAVGGGSPLTTKGDVYGFSTVDARIPIGANNTVLTADSTQALGLKWAAPAAGGGMTLLSTTTLSGASTTISGISGSYKNLVAIIFGVTNASSDDTFICKPNNAATSSVICADTSAFRTSDTDIILTGKSVHPSRTNANNAYALQFSNYASTTAYKPIIWSGFFVTATPANKPIWGGGAFRSNSAITSLVFASEGGDLSTGTVLLYGVS